MAAEQPAEGRIDLDDPASYEGVDPSGMFGYAEAFPSQVEEAARIGRDFSPPTGFQHPKQIVLAGMGGSAVTGDFLARLCEDRVAAPFSVIRGYQIPAFVGRDTLFIASSHSGDTEETLAATSAALRREARIICITTGGKLKGFVQRHKGRRVALLEIPQKDPPMQPRAALGYSLIPLVRAFETLGLYPGAGRQIGEAISLLQQLRDRSHTGVPTQHNRAKQLALELYGKIPWIQGTVGIMGAVAYRWRTQCDENSKALACSSEYPELNHNEVIGWERAEKLQGQLSVIILRSPSDHWRIRARVDITRKKLVEPKAPVRLIEAEGRSPLAQLMWTVYLGDWVTLYLAVLNRVDPGSIQSINTLKRDLEKLQRPRG
jgi:glucose/mannose-6-phosphate isomerase